MEPIQCLKEVSYQEWKDTEECYIFIILLNEKSQSEKTTDCMIQTTCMTFWRRQNFGNSKKISSYQRLGEEGMNR